jgi:hypothetical protein
MNYLLHRNFKAINWSAIIMFALGFWLSGSLVLDLVIIPSLSAAGMMESSGFASAGYLIFGIFNKIELLSAALTLTGFLVFNGTQTFNLKRQRLAILLSAILLLIASIYTYILTPQMSGMGMQLNLFIPSNGMSQAMISMHESYWCLEIIKLTIAATLLRWSYRNSCTLDY